MITLNQEQPLGQKAYLLIASRKMVAGLVVLLVALVLFAVSGPIASLAHRLFSAAGANGGNAASAVSGGITDAMIGLLIIGLIALAVGLIIARLEYLHFTYTFEEFDLRIRRGILQRSETSLPYRQIQDVDIDRSVAHQLLGLSKLTIITAGHEESAEHEKVEAILDPVEKGIAEEIRVMLERKIGVQVTKTVEEADEESSAGTLADTAPAAPVPVQP